MAISNETILKAAGGGIIDADENVNGGYVRFANGFLICYSTEALLANTTKTFPYPFKTGSRPCVIQSLSDVTSLSLMSYTIRSTKSITNTSFIFGITGAGQADWVAFGKWR